MLNNKLGKNAYDMPNEERVTLSVTSAPAIKLEEYRQLHSEMRKEYVNHLNKVRTTLNFTIN